MLVVLLLWLYNNIGRLRTTLADSKIDSTATGCPDVNHPADDGVATIPIVVTIICRWRCLEWYVSNRTCGGCAVLESTSL